MTAKKLDLSRHAQGRMAQRGIRHCDVEAILEHSDMEREMRNGVSSLFISKKRLRQLTKRGDLGTQQAERLIGKVVLLGEATEDKSSQVVTVFPLKGRKARYYI